MAYEVHWLVYAAVRFKSLSGQDKVLCQDSTLLHARNLLEFTDAKAHSNIWWVNDLGGQAPPADAPYGKWINFINGAVSHFGNRRRRRSRWPAPKDDERLVTLADCVLERLEASLSAEATDVRVDIMRDVAVLGRAYIAEPSDRMLEALAVMTESTDG